MDKMLWHEFVKNFMDFHTKHLQKAIKMFMIFIVSTKVMRVLTK
jgi:hypothetical protein